MNQPLQLVATIVIITRAYMPPKRPPDPFHYGSPAGADHFCDRDEELAAIEARMLSGNNVVLLSPRRYGKSSLLLRTIDRVRRKGGASGYITLIRCSSRREVAEAVASGILNGPLSALTRRRENLKDLLRELRVAPVLGVDATGGFTLSFAAGTAAADWDTVLADSLRLLARRSMQRATSLVLDEFQRVLEIDANLGGVFKAIADELNTTSLVFAGSKLHLMERLASGPGAPLMGMGERIVLDVVPEEELTRYLVARAAAAGKPMSREVASLIYAAVDGIPNDVQRLAFEAFQLGAGAIDEEVVAIAMQRIVSHQSTDYGELYERLAPTQQRVLRTLAGEPTTAVYSAAFLRDTDISNPNSVRAALDVLQGRELVQRRDGRWMVSNAFLRAWLSQ
ncbi:MAG: AAA family ATPase [Candidatus Dormibacteria bacterium]